MTELEYLQDRVNELEEQLENDNYYDGTCEHCYELEDKVIDLEDKVIDLENRVAELEEELEIYKSRANFSLSCNGLVEFER